jgi:hypothetical protein
MLGETESNTGDGVAANILEASLAAAAATVGDTDRGRRYFTGVDDFDGDVVGEADRQVANALLALQMGNLDAAVKLVDQMPDPSEGRGSMWGWAVVSLIEAAQGHDVVAYVKLVGDAQQATYADRVLARCAQACAHARAGDEAAARRVLDEAYAAVPRGGDRVHPTVVALCEAQCLETLLTSDAGAAEVRATKAAEAVGIAESGWRTVFALACGSPALAPLR